MNAWRSSFAWLLLAVTLVATGAHAQGAAQPGDDFLRSIDEKRYGDSWDLSSDYFKQAVSKSDWSQQVGQARSTLGDVASRRLRSSEPQTNPPGG